MATNSSILAWRILMDRGVWLAIVHGITESDMTDQLSTAQHLFRRKMIHRGLLGGQIQFCFIFSSSYHLIYLHESAENSYGNYIIEFLFRLARIHMSDD